MSKLSPHQALVHIMVTRSAADTDMTDQELSKIGNIVQNLPVFNDYSGDMLLDDARACGEILQGENGLDQITANALEALPPHLNETAYAVAVEVAAADLELGQEELRLLQIMRDRLNIDKLIAAAIERGARARHQVV